MDTTLHSRYEALLEKSRRVETNHAMLQEREVSLKAEIEHLGQEDILLEKVGHLFKHLIHKYVNEYADSFSDIVTEGLKAIYHDQDVRFRIEVEQKRGKVSARFVVIQNGVEGDPLQAFGGGVSSVISLLLRILVLLKAGKSRYLFLDESLAALSEEYVEACGEFLRKLCADLGVQVLLVTHNPSFIDLADNVYMGSPDANERLQLKKIR